MELNNNNHEIVFFGNTNFRNKQATFGIKMDDRRRHMYVIGKTGMGKSELLKNIAIQDILSGRGLACIDPHGDLVEDLLDYIPPERVKDVIYINPADMEFPIAFNVMELVDSDKRHLVADGIMAVFKKLWIDAWSSRMEYILNYTILALLEVPGTTLLGINRMLAEKEYRKWVVEQIKDSEVKAFWTKEFAGYTERYTAEAVPAIQNKIGQFVSNALIRNIIGQDTSSFDVRQAMDQGKILLINLSKGRVGEDASRLLGALIITKIQLAAMSRVDIPMHERKDFVLMVDEFQNFATASFANILSEARKFKLSLVVAHQYVAQMDEAVADAVFGNVGTIVSFRVGAEDAEMLEKEFAPEFTAEDIVNLAKRQIYLRLMIDGVASRAFSAMTMDTLPRQAVSLHEQVIDASRGTYGHSRQAVEEGIVKWRETSSESESEPMDKPKKPRFDGGQSYNRQEQRQQPRYDNPRPYQQPEQFPRPPYQYQSPRPQPRTEERFDQPRPQSATPRLEERSEPSRFQFQPKPAPQAPQPPRSETPQRAAPPTSLGDLLKRDPVDFKGRTVIPKEKPASGGDNTKPKPEVDLKGLHSILDNAIAKSKEE